MITSLTEIVSGQKYRSKKFPGAIYYGCLDIDRVTKFLIVLSVKPGDSDFGMAGNKVDFAATSIEYFGFYPMGKKKSQKSS